MQPHPCELTDERLLKECEQIRQRRSGPGGQHRNKVETAIRLLHLPTRVTAIASERRSQAENLQEALFRLRHNLAIEIRTEIPEDEHGKLLVSALWKSRTAGGKLIVSSTHADFPRLLAEALNALHKLLWDDVLTAAQLNVSRTQLIRFLKQETRALQLLNEQRSLQGKRPLS